MEKGYDKEIDLYCRNTTNHYHCKASPYMQSLDHDNLQKNSLSTCHEKASPTGTPLAPCQNFLQENHARNAADNLQIRHQLLHLKSHNLKPNSLQVFQRKYQYVFP